MATEYPPLGKSYVISYANNDRDYPIIGIRKDPRVDNYKIPNDLFPHPDSVRYPNHVFTGANPTNSDERVLWVYEILPSPWVPFTRYDDDLGPIQGRRRSVKNEGQQASLTASTKTSYEGREGSAIVSNEIEESWSIKVDEDGNSLFPVKVRDFYDSSRGAVEERRQLFVPTGEEVATLENINGIITQTSYEVYNEYLSYKVVQTYAVDGPELVSNSTNNEGQLVTVTTQRKASDNYVAPEPTATRTVETSREDAESLIERIVETPEVFSSKLIGKEAADPAPAKFRVAAPTTTEEETVEGTVEEPVLGNGDISKSQQQVSKFVKRVRSTFRNLLNLPKSLTQKATNNQGQLVTITETLKLGDTTEAPSATKTIESEALGDGTYVVRKSEVKNVFANKNLSATKTDLTPEKFKAKQIETTRQESVAGEVSANLTLANNEFSKSEEQVTEFVKRTSSTTRDIATTNSLSEKVITPDGQVASRALTLAQGDQTISGGATVVDGSVEALGDGRTIKTLTTVPSLLPKAVFSAQKPDVIPEKFRANIPVITQSSIKAGSPTQPSLGADDLEASQQSLGAHTYRDSKTRRNNGPYDTLDGLDYDEQFDIGIKYTESVTTNFSGGKLKEIDPLGDGKYLKREYQAGEIKEELEQFYESYPTTISLDLPRILRNLNIDYEQDVTSGSSTIHPEYLDGSFKSIALDLSVEQAASITYTPKVEVDFETIWSKNLEATNHIFFLEGPITKEDILEKCGAGDTWPVFKTTSKTFELKGIKLYSKARASATRSIQIVDDGGVTYIGKRQQKSDSEDRSKDFEIITVEIPPCLTMERNLNSTLNLTQPLNVFVNFPEIRDANNAIVLPAIESRKEINLTETLTYNVNIPKSTPEDVPREGIYLIDSSVQFFKYGWFLVTATTLDASQFA